MFFQFVLEFRVGNFFEKLLELKSINLPLPLIVII